ncbi:MAG: DUF2808 domain-containing protein [Cyanobacteriota bacterium]|nr:DUF2808 domain-containing protein [Cyanobacteriota bacterium]
MAPFLRPDRLRSAAGLIGASLTVGAAATLLPLDRTSAPLLGLAPAQAASGTCESLMSYRWEGSKDFRSLTCFMTETTRLRRSEYFLKLRAKDRKTAILKLSISLPANFDTKINPKLVRLCEMSDGGMLSRTRCEKVIPATVEVTPNGRAIEIFPETPVSDQGTIGVHMTLFNPFTATMYQLNAMAQAPGDIPVSGYLGSWTIQIEPN